MSDSLHILPPHVLSPHILIVADQASTRRGGEAILPYHYFRLLRQRGVDVRLVVHERTREELLELFPEDGDRLYFIADPPWHIRIWKLGSKLPSRVATFTTGFVLDWLTQRYQKALIKQLIQEHDIQVVHQPTPVSPKLPSQIYGLGVPVVIDPMNGAMDYPTAFRQKQSWLQDAFIQVARQFSGVINTLIPGKKEAAILLVANARTCDALPKGRKGTVIEVVENGVDLSLWAQEGDGSASAPAQLSEETNQRAVTQFIFMGRLVDWKAIDLLLLAFQKASQSAPIALKLIGDGDVKASLEQQAKALQVWAEPALTADPGKVQFMGWMAQKDCAHALQQSDALILPSLLECGGAVVLEAMACRLPVIATRWGGPVDYLDDSCGILVDPSSRAAFIDGLAAAMVTLAHDPFLKQQMGQAGYAKVQEKFDWNTKIDAILAIYRQAIHAA